MNDRMYDKPPEILPRSTWDLGHNDWIFPLTDESGKAAPGEWPPEKQHTINKLVAHHSGTFLGDCRGAATVRSFREYHTRSKGWADIGYHYIIDSKAKIYIGRHEHTIGAHCGTRNAPKNAIIHFGNPGAIGICVVGNFALEEPTGDQKQVLTHLLLWLSKKHELNPRADWYGHCENIEPRGTNCPGYALMVMVTGMRRAEILLK